MRFFLCICLFVSACSGESLPKNVLPPKKMESVLYDFIRADEMVDFLKIYDSTYQPLSRRTALYDTIFQLHGVQKEAFQKSMRYYQGRPDLLKDILEGLHKKTTDTTRKVQRLSK